MTKSLLPGARSPKPHTLNSTTSPHPECLDAGCLDHPPACCPPAPRHAPLVLCPLPGLQVGLALVDIFSPALLITDDVLDAFEMMQVWGQWGGAVGCWVHVRWSRFGVDLQFVFLTLCNPKPSSVLVITLNPCACCTQSGHPCPPYPVSPPVVVLGPA